MNEPSLPGVHIRAPEGSSSERMKAPEWPAWQCIQNGPLAGREMYLAKNSPILSGAFDDEIFEILGAEGYENKVIWDVGGWIGYHSPAFAVLTGPSGRVVTFEPNHANVERIKLHLARHGDLAGRIELVHAALSDQEGQSILVASSNLETGQSSGSHLAGAFAPESDEIYEPFDRYVVHTTTLDNASKSYRTPDIVKIDVEGAEHLVLHGGEKLLSSVRPTLIIEVHHILAMLDIQKLLGRLSYEVVPLHGLKPTAGRCHILASPR